MHSLAENFRHLMHYYGKTAGKGVAIWHLGIGETKRFSPLRGRQTLSKPVSGHSPSATALPAPPPAPYLRSSIVQEAEMSETRLPDLCHF